VASLGAVNQIFFIVTKFRALEFVVTSLPTDEEVPGLIPGYIVEMFPVGNYSTVFKISFSVFKYISFIFCPVLSLEQSAALS